MNACRMNLKSFPKPAQAYIVSVIFLGIAALIASAIRHPISLTDWLIILPCLLLSAGAALLRVPVLGFKRSQENSTENSTISLGMVPTVFLLLTFGPFVGALAGAITAIVATMYPRRSYPVQILFSVGAVVLAVLVAYPLILLTGVVPIGHSFPPHINTSGTAQIGQAFITLDCGCDLFFRKYISGRCCYWSSHHERFP